MFVRFTRARRRRFLRQMIVWTVCLYFIVPIGMTIFPYMIKMPPEEYGVSAWSLLTMGFRHLFVTILWFIGAMGGLAAHIFNPLTKDEKLGSDPPLTSTKP